MGMEAGVCLGAAGRGGGEGTPQPVVVWVRWGFIASPTRGRGWQFIDYRSCIPRALYANEQSAI